MALDTTLNGMKLNQDLVKHELEENWGWILVIGLMTIMLGVLAVAAPLLIAITLNIFLGFLFFFAGVLKGIHAIHRRHRRGFLLALLSSVVSIALGIMLVVSPMTGVLTLTLLISSFLVVQGALTASWSIRLRPAKGWIWTLLSGIFEIGVGAMIWVQWPGSAAWLIGLLVGINLIFSGWSMIALSVASRHRAIQKN